MKHSGAADDALQNVLVSGILGELHQVHKAGHRRATIILTYCGIDALAFLDMPAGSRDVKRDDFISWVDRYLVFCDGLTIPGLELYAARCALVHTYTAEANLHRAGKVQRKIGYMDEALPEIQDSADVIGLVLVSVRGFVDAFNRGVQHFIQDITKDDVRRQTVARRLLEMVHELPAPKASKST